MITEEEVLSAINQCMNEPITGAKRTALADLIIIQDYLFGKPRAERVEYVEVPVPTHSGVLEDGIVTDGGSEFLEAINGKKPKKVWKVVNELVEAIKTLHPRMYESFMDKIYD